MTQTISAARSKSKTFICLLTIILLLTHRVTGQESKFDETDLLSEEIIGTNPNFSFEDDLVIGSRIDLMFDGLFQNVDSSEYTYNLDNNLETLVTLTSIPGSQIWDFNTRTLYEYDSNGNRTTILRQDWIDGTWIDDYKLNFVYNELDQLIVYKREERVFDELEDDFIVFYEFTGDLLTRFLVQQSVNGEWIDNIEAFIQYDDNGYRTERFQKRWDGVEWINFTLVNYVHDLNGNRIIEEHLHWIDGAWTPDRKRSNEYTSENLIIRSLSERANFNLEYEPESEVLFTYNENNLLETETSSIWSFSDWDAQVIEEHSYDDRDNLIYVLTKQSSNGFSPPEDTFQAFFYYQFAVSNIDIDKDQLILNLFPNPTAGLIELDFKDYINEEIEISLFSVDGKKITSATLTPLSEKINFNLSGFQNGTYIIKIQAQGISVNKKVVLQK